MSFRITGPGFYRTRDGRRAEVLSRQVELRFQWCGVIEAVIQYWTEEGIALHRGGSGPGENLVAPWEESVEQKPNPTRTRDVEAERGQADLARFLQLTPPLTGVTCPQTPYHRTEQFRAETARMLMAAVVNRLGIWEPCIPDVTQQTDALIAALDKPQPTTP
jgi:hypothetical protein